MSPRDHIKVESNCLIFSGFLFVCVEHRFKPPPKQMPLKGG